jgi:hypothetical protein
VAQVRWLAFDFIDEEDSSVERPFEESEVLEVLGHYG